MNFNTTFLHLFNDLQRRYPILLRLILVNIGVWFVLNLLMVAGFLFRSPGMGGDEKRFVQAVLIWLAVPADVGSLLSHPWTPFTYMFTHQQFWHLVFNLLWLWWFGSIFLQISNSRRLLVTYVVGGISGAMAFMISYQVFPVFVVERFSANMVGASASVMALVLCTTVLVPDLALNLLFIGLVKLKYMALFIIIIDILMIRDGNSGGHFAHLGGALAGMALGLVYKGDFLKSRLFNFARTRKPRVKYTNPKPLSDEEYNRIRADKQKQIDSILDKISKSGYSSLSASEKELLFKSSEKK